MPLRVAAPGAADFAAPMADGRAGPGGDTGATALADADAPTVLAMGVRGDFLQAAGAALDVQACPARVLAVAAT